MNGGTGNIKWASSPSTTIEHYKALLLFCSVIFCLHKKLKMTDRQTEIKGIEETASAFKKFKNKNDFLIAVPALPRNLK